MNFRRLETGGLTKGNAICQRQAQGHEFYNYSVRPPVPRLRKLITDVYILTLCKSRADYANSTSTHSPRNHSASYCTGRSPGLGNEKKDPKWKRTRTSRINRHLESRYFLFLSLSLSSPFSYHPSSSFLPFAFSAIRTRPRERKRERERRWKSRSAGTINTGLIAQESRLFRTPFDSNETRPIVIPAFHSVFA